MQHLSFRTKLLLAMMLVVTAVSIATLLVAQQRIRRNYERMFRNQFDRQIAYFTTLQESRLGAIKEQCLNLSKSVRLMAALDTPEVSATNLYEIAADELRQVLAELRGPGPPTSGENRASFGRFLDAEGKVILLPEAAEHPRLRLFNLHWRLQAQLKLVREALTSDQIQQVGYLALPVATNRPNVMRTGLRRVGKTPARERLPDDDDVPVLQEVIVTKIIDSANGHVLGVLALGFALPDLVPRRRHLIQTLGETNQTEIIQTGVLLEDKLYADPTVIPEAIGGVVAQKISEHIATTKSKDADFECVVGASHYRVFYELMTDSKAFPAAYQVCLYSMDEALREQRVLIWKVIGLGIGGLLVALALSLFIANGLSSPLRELVGGTSQIERGNFGVRVPVRSRDELGRLAQSFNDMAAGLAQKEKYRTVLNMVQDESIARQLIEGGLTLGGELREITVLFCDIRGFTSLTQHMPPGEVIELLNEHMTALRQVVKQHHGVVDKFVGDLVMAIFGAPLKHGDDTANAARCSLDLLRVREKLNETSRHHVRIGIGLATGTVIAGKMGSPEHMNYTVLGERVNLASRLCSRAAANEILIDEHTREKLGSLIMVEPTGEVELKGFATLVPAYRLLGITVVPPNV